MAAWRYQISLLVLKKYFTHSLRPLMKYHSKRNFVSLCSHVISSIYCTGRAWGGDLIVFVGPGVRYLTDLVVPGEGIFESFFSWHGDIWLPTWTKKTEHMFPASTLHACAVRFEKIRKSWRPMRTSLCTDVAPVLACFWSVESLKIPWYQSKWK